MTNPDEVSLVEKHAFELLDRKYVQHADARQRSMGLQYMTVETHDLAKLIAQYALSATPLVKLREGLDWLDANRRLSVEHYSPTYCDDDDQSEEWRIIRQGGSINDREYTCVGRGETPLDAILDARTALSSNLEGG